MMPRWSRSPLGTYYRSIRRVRRRARGGDSALLFEAARLTNRLYWRATTLPESVGID